MVVACWSVKGGVGTTAVSVVMAMASVSSDRSVLLVDLAGDVPGCLGIPEPGSPGVAEWLAAAASAPPDALARLVAPVAPGLSLLHRGAGALDAENAGLLLQLLASAPQTVVADCGRIDVSATGRRVAAEADRSVLVTRLCLLGVRRAATAPVRPSGVVVVKEAGRALPSRDIETIVGAPLVAEVAVSPSMARALDIGLLHARVPRGVSEALRSAAA